MMLLLLSAHAAPLRAEEQEDASSVAKKTQNPGAVLVSFPFQFNFNGDIGPYDRTQMLLNIQPVLPVPFSKEYALITRWVTPVISQPIATAPNGATFGVGDLNPQLFLAANLQNGMTYGFGASFILPTATESSLGQGKLSLGPSLLLAHNGDALVTGALLTTAASIAGDSSRSAVGQGILQPFINYNVPGGEYVVTAPQIIWDWRAGQWTVPLGGGIGKVYQFGETPVNINVQGYYNAASPDIGPDWQARLVLQFVYAQPSKGKKE